MRILITGGAGFIGSHLAEYLLASGHEVDVLDDLSSGRNNVPKGVTFWHMRCQEIYELNRSWDFVYHMASTVGVNRVLEDPGKCIRNVIDSTLAVTKLGIPGMYFSTSEVYGKNERVLGEDSDCVLSSAKRWSYAAAKLCGEWLSGWKTVRLFNVVGKRQNPAYGAVFQKFVEQAVFGQPITVHGDGSQVRTFIDVRDCVEILDKLRDKDFEVTNVGGPHVMSVVDLAKEIRRLTNSTSEIRFVEYPHGNGFEECQTRIPDLSRMKSLIGKFKYRGLDDTVIDACQPVNAH